MATPTEPTQSPQPTQTPQAAPTPPRARPDAHERIDGLRAWIAQLDRKLGTRTYLLGALALLAAAAAAAALVLVIQLKQDAATEDDVNVVRDQITGVEQSATSAAQQGVSSLEQRLSDLETEVSQLSNDQRTSKRELQVVQDDIKELRSQASSAPGAGGTTAGP